MAISNKKVMLNVSLDMEIPMTPALILLLAILLIAGAAASVALAILMPCPVARILRAQRAERIANGRHALQVAL